MTIENVKKVVENNKGIVRLFRFRGTRNQIDEFEGVITTLYPAIFTITSVDYQIKSFSYSDLLINNLEIVN